MAYSGPPKHHAQPSGPHHRPQRSHAPTHYATPMIAVLADTHSDTDHALTGHARQAVADADAVVHAGDFTTESSLDAFHDAATRLHAVHGNADSPAVRDRLPPARTITTAGLRIALTHREPGGDTALSLFGRERGADIVVSGHTHTPTLTTTPTAVLLNPGSHADPRGSPAAHATLHPTDHGVRIAISTRDGDTIRSTHVSRD
ncbi:conserved hypothetical protein [Halobacterium salinarum NRC-1]|uniref:Phosphoesterase n=4 Tax=Halobacterium salinarum TaxID=2242 RepID=Q9HMP6_HALSA|nr:conserved hypothetical protein [Halobacterium salinarum NRC-1]